MVTQPMLPTVVTTEATSVDTNKTMTTDVRHHRIQKSDDQRHGRNDIIK